MRPSDELRSPPRLRLNTARERGRIVLTLPTSILLGSALLAVGAIAVASLMVFEDKPARYQLVNVGDGETQRLDRETGTITRCVDGECYDLTSGPEPLEFDEVIWDYER